MEKNRTAETFVFSQRWKGFALTVGSNSLGGALAALNRWVQGVAPLEAVSGYRVQVVLPAEMPDGHFAGTVELLAQAAGPGGLSRKLQLPIQGRIDGRVSIFGPSIDTHQVLRLGVLQRGAAAREKVLLKVSDARRQFALRRIESEPEFLRVRLAPYHEGSAKQGLYRLDVEVPGTAPCLQLQRHRRGYIRLLTDHPHLPSIGLKVDFSVIGDATQTGAVAGR